MRRPLLLLDVDGVLCPSFRYPLQPGQELVSVGIDETVVIDVGIQQRLQRLARHFDLTWSSSWEHRANECIGPLYALPQLPAICFTDRKGSTWKLSAAAQYVGDRPFAWVDDEFHQDAHQWAAVREIPALLVDVDPRQGLTDRLVDLLLAFAEDLASDAFER